tara:strand:+ start:24462 stop:24923 length:462 start_codon:yes stop_codon:yes gene_type:complete
MDPVKALTSDYDSTLSFIDKCDAHMFRIKNWALITTSAIVAYSISSGTEFVVLVNLVLIPAFLYLELIYKSFQDSAIDHTTDVAERIDIALSHGDTDDLIAGYEFGFGRNLKCPSLSRCIKIFRNKNRRHISNFYSFIVLFSIGAFVVGRCLA